MQVIAANWWAFILRGILAIGFGILTFIIPGMALITLVFLFGFYAIAEGIFNTVAAFRRSSSAGGTPWWALLLEGLFSIIAGLFALFLPGLTALALLYVIAAWAIVNGCMKIAAAARLRKQIRGEWMLALAGALSICLGLLLAIFPGAGALAMVLWIGAFAFVFGILLIALGLQLRRWMRISGELGHNEASGPAPSQ